VEYPVPTTGGVYVTDFDRDGYLDVLVTDLTGNTLYRGGRDGKFTDEDLSGEGNAFVAIYYGSDGPYLADYAEAFGDLMYVASEDEHDFKRFTQMVDRRYNAHTGGTKKPWWKAW